MSFVRTLNEFKHNLLIRSFSAMWLSAIDFSKLVMVGGCVLNALCLMSSADSTGQDINLIYSLGNWMDFEETVTKVMLKLRGIHRHDEMYKIRTEAIPGSCRYDILLPCGIKLNFLFKPAVNSKLPLSHTLYQLDFDIHQVAYTGMTSFFIGLFIRL